MADDQTQEAPEATEEVESEATTQAENENQEDGQEDGAEGETVEGEEAEGEADEGESDEGEADETNAAKASEMPQEPPIITAGDVFSLFMPSQNTLDKRAARVEYLKQLKVADQIACQKAMEIQQLKLLVEDMEKKTPMTQAESDLLDQKQQELFNMLQEFEEMTKKVHELAALAELDSKSSIQISPYDEMLGPPLPTSAILNFNQISTGIQAPVKMEDTLEFVPPKEKLPKLVICGSGDWPPKIVICESPKTAESGTNTDSQIILKLKNEIQKTKSGSQIPVKKLYSKLKDLDKDIMDVEKENAQLTRKLLQLLQGDRENHIEVQHSWSEASKEQDADVPEDDMNVVPSGDRPESPGEGSVASPESQVEGSVASTEIPGEGSVVSPKSLDEEKVSSELVGKSSVQDQQLELPLSMLPSVPNCTCGRRSNAFSLEFELTKIETEVQRMLTEIDSAANKSEKPERKPTVVIGSCNIAALYNPS